MEMNTGWLCEVDYQGMCHEPDDQQMAAKCLHQCLWWGISASISRFEFQLMRGGLLLTGRGKTFLFCLVLLFGLNKGNKGRLESGDSSSDQLCLAWLNDNSWKLKHIERGTLSSKIPDFFPSLVILMVIGRGTDDAIMTWKTFVFLEAQIYVYRPGSLCDLAWIHMHTYWPRLYISVNAIVMAAWLATTKTFRVRPKMPFSGV